MARRGLFCFWRSFWYGQASACERRLISRAESGHTHMSTSSQTGTSDPTFLDRVTNEYNRDVKYSISYPKDVTASTPVVFLLGWMGSNLKVLRKFYPLYNDPPCVIISYAVSVYDGFCRHPNSSFYLETAESLVELLQKHDLQSNPVLIHLFCNGGYTIYQGMADPLLHRENKVLGVTLDSAPRRNRYHFGFNAIRSLPGARNPIAAFVALTAFSMIFASWKFRELVGLNELNKVYRVMSTSQTHLWPHLFLYSSADQLVPARSVLEMAEKREKSGAALVRTHDFGTSPHVSHYRLFPGTYSSKVRSFLGECLTNTRANLS